MSLNENSVAYLEICSYYETEIEDDKDELEEEEAEKVRELLETATSKRFEDILPNERRELTNEDLQDIEILYSDDELELPSPEEYSAISINVDSEHDIHIHSRLDYNGFEDLIDVHSEVGSQIGDLVINYIRVYLRPDIPFEEFPFKIEGLEKGDLRGIEIEDEDFWLGIRKHNEESVRITFQNLMHLELVSPDELRETAESAIKKSLETIEVDTNEPT
jgi:hypothetical protein